MLGPPGSPPIIFSAPPSAAPGQAGLKEDPNDQFGKKGDHPGDDHRDNEKADVAIANMSELVAEHGLKLRVVERLHQALRHCDRILLRIHSARKGIEGFAIHDLEFW